MALRPGSENREPRRPESPSAGRPRQRNAGPAGRPLRLRQGRRTSVDRPPEETTGSDSDSTPPPSHTSGPLTDGYSLPPVTEPSPEHVTDCDVTTEGQRDRGPRPSPPSRERCAAARAAPRIVPNCHLRPGLPSPVTTRSRHGHALCRLRLCARNTREPGRPSPGARIPSSNAEEKGRGGDKGTFYPAREQPRGSVTVPPAAAAHGVWDSNSSGVVSKSPFKFRDCAVTPDPSRSEGSVTHVSPRGMPRSRTYQRAALPTWTRVLGTEVP